MKKSFQLVTVLAFALAVGCAPETQTSGDVAANDDEAYPVEQMQALEPTASADGEPTTEGPVSETGEAAQPIQQPQQNGERRGGGGGFGRGGGGYGFLVRNEQVQAELGLTEEQVAKIEAALPERLRDMSDEEREKAITKMEADIKAVLKPEQSKRLGELRLQTRGARALTDPEVVKQLGLSADQVKTIEAALEIPRPEGGQSPGGQGGFDREAFMKAREEANAKALAALTADQKKKWEAMQGKKFEFQAPQRGGGGASITS